MGVSLKETRRENKPLTKHMVQKYTEIYHLKGELIETRRGNKSSGDKWQFKDEILDYTNPKKWQG